MLTLEELMKQWNEKTDERRGKIGQLYMLKVYFTYGHQHWLGFLVSVGTFMMVGYTFAVTNWPIIGQIFSPVMFLFIAGPVYFLTAVLVGRWAYFRGPFKTRAALEWRENPVVKEIFALLYQILLEIQSRERPDIEIQMKKAMEELLELLRIDTDIKRSEEEV